MQVVPRISEQFNGLIWRMEIDELSETIFVELRNNDQRKVSFAAISLVSGEILFKEITGPEKWLTGIEAAYDGVLLVHFYQSETGPAHKGLLAIYAVTTETLWSNFNYAFDHLSADGPVVYDTRLQPRKLLLADIKTGATVQLPEYFEYEDLQRSIVLPAIVNQELLAGTLFTRKAYGNIVHYLEYNNLRIVSLHALNEEKLTQSLYILRDDSLVFEDLLNTDIQKIQPEAFMMHKNRLIYIKNKSELKILTL